MFVKWRNWVPRGCERRWCCRFLFTSASCLLGAARLIIIFLPLCSLGQTGLTRIGPCQVRDQIRQTGCEREGIGKKKLNRIEEAGSGTTATLVSKSGHRRVPSKEPLIGCSVVKAGVIGHGPRVGDDEVRTTRRRGSGPGCSQVGGREVFWNYVCTRLAAVAAADRERRERARGDLTRRIGRAKVARVRWSGWYQSSRYTSTSTMDTARRAVAAVAAGGRERRRASARYG